MLDKPLTRLTFRQPAGRPRHRLASVQAALAQASARGSTHSALVAVQGSQRFWERLGYRVHEALDARAKASLHTYPDGAVYMARRDLSGSHDTIFRSQRTDT